MSPLSGVLREAWQLYRKFAAHLLAIAFVIYLVAAVVVGLLSLAGVIGGLLAFIVELFATFLLQATLVKAVQDIRDGRVDLNLGETVSAATPYIWAVAGASILAVIAIVIGFILLIIPGLWLITIWAVIIPVIVIERAGAMDSFGRSRRLVKGHGWYVFGTLVLVFIIQLVVSIVLSLIFLRLPMVWRNGLSTFISGVLIAPFNALVVTLIYYRLVGATAAAGGYGTPPQAGYGTPPPAGYGTPPPAGYGTPPPPTDYGTQPPPAGYGTQPPPAGYGTQPPPADYGTQPLPTDYGLPPRADDGTQPSADHGTPPPGGQDAPAPGRHEAPPPGDGGTA
jgi:hypothetical protein